LSFISSDCGQELEEQTLDAATDQGPNHPLEYYTKLLENKMKLGCLVGVNQVKITKGSTKY
jgi:hypothetical protein